MRNIQWTHTRVMRLLIIFATLLIYAVLLVASSIYSLSTVPTNLPLFWLSFSFSSFVGLLFFTVAVLVWLYASNRSVALLVYSFSSAMMVAFAVRTGAESDNIAFSTIAAIVSTLTVPLLFALLLFFPKNYFAKDMNSTSKSGDVSHKINRLSLFASARSYILGSLVLLCVVISICYVVLLFTALSNPSWQKSSQWQQYYQLVNYTQLLYFLIGLTSILIVIVISYRQSVSLRARHQLRIFVGGVVLAVAPLLLFTVLPGVLGFPARYSVDGSLSSLSVAFFPLALGYSMLRYQILLFDTYIRRAATSLVGVLFLAILIYLIVALCNIFFSGSLSIIFATGITAVLAPLTWRLATVITERYFFREILHYQRLLDNPTWFVDEALDLENASQLFTSAAVHTFETQQVCLFVLEEGRGRYNLCPPLTDDPGDESRRSLIQTVFQVLKPGRQEETDWLEMQSPALERIAAAKRPLLLGEMKNNGERNSGVMNLGRFITPENELLDSATLLVSVRAQGKMIGLLVLGERGDHQQYAGPDFEIVQVLLSRFSTVLETARLYARANQYTKLLNDLYEVSMTPGSAYQSVEEMANAYAKVAAKATGAAAEIWLCNEEQKQLVRVTSVGPVPRIGWEDGLRLTQNRDWAPGFYEGGKSRTLEGDPVYIPSCLLQAPDFSFAWLPLVQNDQRVGILILSYTHTHFFVKEEVRVLEMFANQCAVSLEDVRKSIELLAAYERQKELDRLKDQFIMTTSHELRTPLTAVQGYIELLNEYNVTLTDEVRGEFIAKAYRGCEELTLMLSNIMDASRVQFDTENIKLHSVSLVSTVIHVLEILEAMIRREDRDVSVAIPENTIVLADEMRLRQILLNLMSNALKYSPSGTHIDITSMMTTDQVALCIRDYGAGIPPEEQGQLFERFVRLERDMNSPVRGAGLGLYISKRLVEAMGGSIWVESSGVAGEGSAFLFTLPVDISVERKTQPKPQLSDVSRF